ncbi:MAG: EAL domain-containing protein [Lachnospiraceae bacterium]|nr:EAL domain-containing protein [Lachnospiraceae bacterium]
MNAEDIIRRFDEAIEKNYIFPEYQPQINHATGRLIGAEALMRWEDPKLGKLYPNQFIPVMEEYDLIYRADIHLFSCVCKFLKKCIDEAIPIVPISVNMSRHDIFNHDYVEAVESIRKAYGVPVEYIRLELTESSVIGGMELVVGVLEQLHAHGYKVEMDDFGSGYSSLNVLKELEVDVIKLDMYFFTGELDKRGGTIITTVVNMAKWLGIPVIAEGVETAEQAEFMKSIGCNYIQGYLYYKPISEPVLIRELRKRDHETAKPAMQLVDTMDAAKFWSPDSLETLIFNHYVGGACIFSYKNGRLELLRVNDKYTQELGMNMSAKQLIDTNPWKLMDEENKEIYLNAINKALDTDDEVVVETWRTLSSDCCGDENICIRSTIRMIGQATDQYLFYAMIQNITAEKRQYMHVLSSEQRFLRAAEQANMYAWEYDIRTKEMRPCFRCMRDLGLPMLVKNYPEPAIEMGIFQPDYADMYRDWHKQLEEGVEHLEAIMPLTVGRVPFHVRYTTEFDENGRPLKAYGSATLVVDEEENKEES